MASVLKSDELVSFRHTLENLRARLRGDLDQMTDEALGRDDAVTTEQRDCYISLRALPLSRFPASPPFPSG